MKKIFAIALVLCLSSTLHAFCEANYTYKQEQPAQVTNNGAIKGQVVYIPVGTTTEALVSSEINSATATLGSIINLTLNNTLSVNGKTIAPKGSVISGTVVVAKKAGRANRNGEIMIRFSSITTPEGYKIPVSAVIKTNDNSGLLTGGTKKDATIDYTKNTVVGAGGGAVLGTALGALSGGSVGLGAVYGTAIGAGAGVIKGLADKGQDVKIPVNSIIEIYFDQPITTASPTQSY